MVQKLINSIRHHEHWFAEWWSSILLICIGMYGLFIPKGDLLQKSVTDGFVILFPHYYWQICFIGCGALQQCALVSEWVLGRGVAAFMATSLLLWGTLNMFVFGQQWHFSVIAWGVFALINLYALARILARIEARYENT